MKKLGILILLLVLLVTCCYSYVSSGQVPPDNEVADLKLQVNNLAAKITELEAKKSIKPLNQQITPTRQDWKDAYGDTLETQIIYNLTILRQNDLIIAGVMNNMHPPVDPNVPTLEARVKALEDDIILDVIDKIMQIDPNNVRLR